MNINELTIGEAKELAQIFGGQGVKQAPSTGLNCMIGQKVIVRTYSAGVHFGVLAQKDGSEVILEYSRRLWEWWAAESISLSAVAIFGINQGKSKIAPTVPTIWLESIEIIPCSDAAIKSIEGATDAKS